LPKHPILKGREGKGRVDQKKLREGKGWKNKGTVREGKGRVSEKKIREGKGQKNFEKFQL